MGLCYGTDSPALTVVRREPAGRYSPPLGEAGRGIKWQVSPRLRGRGRKGSGRQPLRGAVESLATAYPLKCGSLAARANGAEGVRESVADLLRHSLPANRRSERVQSKLACYAEPQGGKSRKRLTVARPCSCEDRSPRGHGGTRPDSERKEEQAETDRF